MGGTENRRRYRGDGAARRMFGTSVPAENGKLPVVIGTRWALANRSLQYSMQYRRWFITTVGGSLSNKLIVEE